MTGMRVCEGNGQSRISNPIALLVRGGSPELRDCDLRQSLSRNYRVCCVRTVAAAREFDCYAASAKFYLNRRQNKYPANVFPSWILPPRIISSSSARLNHRVSMRSSSIGAASPSVRSVARKIVIFSCT